MKVVEIKRLIESLKRHTGIYDERKLSKWLSKTPGYIYVCRGRGSIDMNAIRTRVPDTLYTELYERHVAPVEDDGDGDGEGAHGAVIRDSGIENQEREKYCVQCREKDEEIKSLLYKVSELNDEIRRLNEELRAAPSRC
jgi:hypothetical protein